MSSDTPARPDPTSIQAIPSTSTTSVPEVIPPVAELTLPGRSLVLCFDGTSDQYDQDHSNIAQFVQLLKKDDKTKQIVYYQTGIGTGVGPSPRGKIGTKISQTFDTIVAPGLGHHVRAGYKFLMQNWTDRISLFGFSRGAYTARALAGMLHKVGLLPAHKNEQVPFVYHMFKRNDEEGWLMSHGFKGVFSANVQIDFVGLFDTVNSGGIVSRKLPFEKSNYLIRVFRHALALDERRAKFKPNLWGRPTEEEAKLGEGRKKQTHHRGETSGGVRSDVTSQDADQDSKQKEPQGSSHHGGHDFTAVSDRGHQTDVKEVWFVGAHCDVGGGSVPNDTPNSLARIPLRWMIRECFLNRTGILFHSAELEKIGLSPASLWPMVKIPTPIAGGHKPQVADTILVDSPVQSRSATVTAANGTTSTEVLAQSETESQIRTASALVPPEQMRLGSEHDALDALQPIHDQLSISKWWWILELLPMKQRRKSWRVNFGSPRVIHGQKYVHRTVQYRMQQLVYKPRAEILADPGPIWVD